MRNSAFILSCLFSDSIALSGSTVRKAIDAVLASERRGGVDVRIPQQEVDAEHEGLTEKRRSVEEHLHDVKLALEGCSGFQCVERYVNVPDDAYSWKELPDSRFEGSIGGVSWIGHVLEVNSQRWLGSSDTDRQFWSHPVVVVVPQNLRSGAGPAQGWSSLVVGGASLARGVTAAPPGPQDEDVLSAVYLAVRTGTVAAALLQVPNQPLAFSTDPPGTKRYEDQIKAHTWRHFEMDPNSPEWLLELPNAKATVRTMDAIGNFSRQLGLEASRFGISGCSKRANAALMACALDSRCELVMPCSIAANTLDAYRRLMRSFGEPALALTSYFEEHVFEDLDVVSTQSLFAIVDAIGYLDKLKVPKLWLNSVSDDFFVPDHTTAFWSDLPGPKYLYQGENAAHSSYLSTYFQSPAAAFTSYYLSGKQLPEVTWSVDESGQLSVRHLSGPIPVSTSVWSAMTCTSSPRQDFRQMSLDQGTACEACGVPVGSGALKMCNISAATRWLKERDLDPAEKSWNVAFDSPAAGWRGFYVALEFEPAETGSEPLRLSSEVVIVPLGKYPYPDCMSPASASRGGCRGKRLVLAQGNQEAEVKTEQSKTVF